MLQYGAQAFCFARLEILAQMDVVQLKAFKIIAKTFIATSVDSIQTKLSVMPVHLITGKLCLRYWIKA